MAAPTTAFACGLAVATSGLRLSSDVSIPGRQFHITVHNSLVDPPPLKEEAAAGWFLLVGVNDSSPPPSS